jgi:hypothetical protein
MDWNLTISLEGDYQEWYSNGLFCQIQRQTFGKFWCGYVTIPNDYPQFDYEDEIECHGGITYQESVNGGIRIGFDCGHSGDLINLNLPHFILDKDSTYRDKNYVIDQVNYIVLQVLEVKSIKRHLRIDNILE